jgi:hypothetical protein
MAIDDSQSLECEWRAHECVHRAKQSTDPITRDTFAAMAETWAQLARAMASSASQLDRGEQVGVRRAFEEPSSRRA